MYALVVVAFAVFVTITAGNICTCPDRFTATMVSPRRPSLHIFQRLTVDRSKGLLIMDDADFDVKQYRYNAYDFENNRLYNLTHLGKKCAYDTDSNPLLYVDVPDDAKLEATLEFEGVEMKVYSFVRTIRGQEKSLTLTVDEDCYPRTIGGMDHSFPVIWAPRPITDIKDEIRISLDFLESKKCNDDKKSSGGSGGGGGFFGWLSNIAG